MAKVAATTTSPATAGRAFAKHLDRRCDLTASDLGTKRPPALAAGASGKRGAFRDLLGARRPTKLGLPDLGSWREGVHRCAVRRATSRFGFREEHRARSMPWLQAPVAGARAARRASTRCG